MRVSTIANKGLRELLAKKGKMVDKARALSKQINAEEEKVRKQLVEKFGVVSTGDNEDGTVRYEGTLDQFASVLMEVGNPANFTPSKKLEKLTSERNKLALQVQKLKEKMLTILDKEVKPLLSLGEYEEVVGFELKGQKIDVQIVDRVEEYKRNLKR